jgi:alpha-L-fucosidase
MNAFIHFSLNTFTGKEWGRGDESPHIFNPSAFRPEQWTNALKEAGFKGLILTAKHHDGFCLWPSQYTEHSLKYSTYRNGKADIVNEVAQACRKDGLKFGVYLSPWDRNHAEYGKPAYVEYYRNQLKELFGRYGPIFEMWFDGANGGDGFYGGKNETRKIDGSTYYDWPATIKIVKSMEPDVMVFSDAGPDVRWVGNEKGIAGETNWNMMNTDTIFAGKAGIESLLNSGAEDGKKWIPAEVDVSIRPGWFYHAEQNDKVKSAEQLFRIYMTSVGRGSTLLLNIPPDDRGLFHENDLLSLAGFKALLDREFRTNLSNDAHASSAHYRGNALEYGPQNLIDGKKETYWTTDDDSTRGSFEIRFDKPKTIKYIIIQENIALGQRVKSFGIEINVDGSWQEVSTGTTIGYKRIIELKGIISDKIRVVIKESRACPVISNVEIY